MEESFSEFQKKVKKVGGRRKHGVLNSYGVYDIYKHIRKKGWYDIGSPVKEGEFYKIIRMMNKEVANAILDGHYVKLPCKMGSLDLRKSVPTLAFRNGKLINHLPVDWASTLKLWYEDEEAYRDRILVRHERRERFTIVYDKTHADYVNKCYYDFHVNRDVLVTMHQRARQGNLNTIYNKY